ncbi:MAG: hypothetical protein OEN23_14225 [Paracoccaceae bacterium]|nr:hypothetical protein [Paracoccaceae bacterium]
MKFAILSSALVLATLLSACAGEANRFSDDSRKAGHFGAGLHAGRVSGN